MGRITTVLIVCFLFLFIHNVYLEGYGGTNDLDGDGFFADDANEDYVDCCDSVLDGCEDPYMVNPGAYPFLGDSVDNNCFLRDNNPANFFTETHYCDTNSPERQFGWITQPVAGTNLITEEFISAMDICEFVDDDNDPTYGFFRVNNNVFELADGTREFFDDDATTGPTDLQIATLTRYCDIEPYKDNNGGKFAVLTTGFSCDRESPIGINPNEFPGCTASQNLGSDVVVLPSEYLNNPASSPEPGCVSKPTTVFDSITSRFTMRQPSNAHAFSFKTKVLSDQFVSYPPPSACSKKDWFIALKSGTEGVPPDHNIALTQLGEGISNNIIDNRAWQHCDDWPNAASGSPFSFQAFDVPKELNGRNGDGVIELCNSNFFNNFEELFICTRSFDYDDQFPEDDQDTTTIHAIVDLNGATVADVNVRLDVQHDFLGDLVMTLISPSGTRVILFDRDCVFYATDNDTLDDDNTFEIIFDQSADNSFGPTNCVFDDDGAGVTVHLPHESLDILNGEPADGIWSVEFSDTVPLFNGVVSIFQLSITPTAGSFSIIPPTECQQGDQEVDDDVNGNLCPFNGATDWISWGTSALPKEEFELKLIAYESLDALDDTLFLIDDYRPISEKRRFENSHGYQRTSDVAVSNFETINGNHIIGKDQTTVDFAYSIKNWGPEVATDITLSFTPPYGTKFDENTQIAPFDECTKFPAQAPFEDSSFYQCRFSFAFGLPASTSIEGTLSFDIVPENIVRGDSLKFRITATSSSIDEDYANNYKVNFAYIGFGI